MAVPAHSPCGNRVGRVPSEGNGSPAPEMNETAHDLPDTVDTETLHGLEPISSLSPERVAELAA
mgnify:CR=1 FL=1